jgi:hypothetical protein
MNIDYLLLTLFLCCIQVKWQCHYEIARNVVNRLTSTLFESLYWIYRFFQIMLSQWNRLMTRNPHLMMIYNFIRVKYFFDMKGFEVLTTIVIKWCVLQVMTKSYRRRKNYSFLDMANIFMKKKINISLFSIIWIMRLPLQ